VKREAPAEVTVVHSRLLKIALATHESRAYFAHVEPGMSSRERATRAFEERWFGAKSEARVRDLLANFQLRYDAYPSALAALRALGRLDAASRTLVCHWHLQLADPVYRSFTGQWMVERRRAVAPFDRSVVVRWLRDQHGERWSQSTCVQIASKLLSAASEARLCSAKRDPRALLSVLVPDDALAYVLYLLREVSFEQTLVDNPYLRSVGLASSALSERLRGHRDVSLRQMGDVFEFEWAYPSLARWAEARA
jgi:hypothetical protein